MFAHSRVDNVSDEDIAWFRKFFFVGWVAVLGGLPWLFWTEPHMHMQVSTWLPIGLTISSFPIGWFLGYKKLIGPLFLSIIIKTKE